MCCDGRDIKLVLNAKMCRVAMDAQLMVMPNAQAWSFECKDV